MLGLRLITNILLILVFVVKDIGFCASDLTEINEFLDEYNKQGDELQFNETLAAWNYEVTMTAESREQMLKWSEKTARFAVEKRKTAKKLLREIGDEVVPRKLLRQLKLITRTAASRSDVINNEISSLQSKMTSIYSKTVIEKTIGNESYRFRLKEQLLPIMTDVRKENLKNLKWAFRVWREAVGRKIKPLYEKFVPIVNVGAQENGYDDYGDFWRAEYQERHLEQNIEFVLEDMAELYRKVHAYIRFRLNKMLGDDVVGKNGMIPIHLLNMWGQNWSHLYKMFVPYPSKAIPDVTKEMKNKGWDNTDMLRLAESFFVSLGLENMPKSFYRNSVITQPSDTKPACFPSSWDLGHGDVRLKMPCMTVSHNDLMTVHHEMGHIQYYLMYQHQPLEYRTGANPGFHEAVGDTIALSVMTPQHLESIGLLQDTIGDEEEDMNFLLKQALQKIPFIRFAYIVDKWRWSVFQGTTKPEEYNKYWWQLRKKYQGVRTPKGMVREDEELCDPATFFHVAHNTEYLRYFLSHILQFQFHQALCNEAGIGRPYHRCSIYKSKKAGLKLRSMMELGKEYPWNEALEVLTGSNRLSAKPLLNYFKPLEDWLDDHRKEHGYQLGWELEELDV